MSNISKYLKMNSEQLENEILKQQKKITSAKETITLLRKLKIAANNPQKVHIEKINNNDFSISNKSQNMQSGFSANPNNWS